MSEITKILSQIENRDPAAAERLLPLIYDELRQLAAVRLQKEQPGQTLEPTALVHEAYLRLVGDQQFHNRAHFFAAASEAMRRILVDAARRKLAKKHGGDLVRSEWDQIPEVSTNPEETIALNDALQRLRTEEPMVAKVVDLRTFAGFSLEETAELLGISLSTVNRHWAYAKAWLYKELADFEPNL